VPALHYFLTISCNQTNMSFDTKSFNDMPLKRRLQAFPGLTGENLKFAIISKKSPTRIQFILLLL